MKTLKEALKEKKFQEIISPLEKKELNHQAYNDVLMIRKPKLPKNDYYMKCYNFWSNIAKK